ncbi:MAG TPA: Gldg family protein [Myxococcota bacterium]|nr:Gldg family protein [Myxococcota bacterium]HQK52405.1 Gldg family protein [Myxococcota bacterium]
MATQSGRSARVNATVTVVSILGILVLVNVLGVFLFGRWDLTDNKRYSLSEVSRQAVRDLDSVQVQVFVSPDLPGTLDLGYGRERDIRGVAREFLDKLEEYRSYAGGRMHVTRVTEDVENKAQAARLELFTGKEAAVEGGRLEFRRYALGATFQYRNQMEVYPLALEPEYFEFEITKILMRLKEKYEKSQGMQDLLKAGEGVAGAVKACREKIEGYRKSEGDQGTGLAALFQGGGGGLAAMRADAEGFARTCDVVAAEVVKAQALKGRNEYLDQLLGTAQAFVQRLDEAKRLLADPQGESQGLGQSIEVLMQLAELAARDQETLKDSPGRKAIGFLCGHREFCPFAESSSLFRPEVLGLMGQNNPLVQQFASQARAIEDQIQQINEQIRRALFTRKGLTLKRIDPGQDVPDDVEALVVFGPEKPLSDRDLYVIDQFLLSGRSVLVFLNPWDVAVYNFRKGGESLDPSDMTADDLHRESRPTNLGPLLAHYGVQANQDILVEKRDFGDITILQLQRQGRYTLQSQRDFPYPLLPTFSDLDRSHVLVKRLSSVTLPYVSTLSVTDEARQDPNRTVVELIRSSRDASAVKENVELSPPALIRQAAMLPSNGPHTVAVAIQGTFRSFFDGKEIPKRPAREGEDKATPERPFQAQGQGRLLVIGSNLGLENLSPEKVFDGFSLSMLTSGRADFFLRLKDYIANFQNWQLRLTQISPIVMQNLDFLFNALDWGIQNEALVDIRSKAYVKRPIRVLAPGVQTAIQWIFILGLPALFALYGVFRTLSRRRRS